MEVQGGRVGDTASPQSMEFLPPELRSRLLPFQKEGIAFAISKNGRCLIADEMGLGKTLQAIGVMCYYREEWPVVIIVPASLKYSWAEELERWLPELLPEHIAIVNSTSDISAMAVAKVTIISYGVMRSGSRHGALVRQAIANKKFGVVIADESHNIKNSASRTCKTVTLIMRRSQRCLLLSGTPALNRPAELFTQIDVLRNGLFGTWSSFTRRYCNAHMSYFGKSQHWNTNGAANLEELEQRLRSEVMIRRLKKDVLTQLPPKRRQKMAFDIKFGEDAQALKEELATLLNQLESLVSSKGMTVGAVMSSNCTQAAGDELFELRKLVSCLYCRTCEAKIGPVVEFVKSCWEDKSSKMLLFAHHRMMLDGLQSALWKESVKHIRIDGNVPSIDRTALVKQFQSDPETRIALLSILAAGQGLTLTAASTVVFAELFWTPAVLEQCEDRAHRIGQANSVNIYYLVAHSTLDEHIWSVLQRKTTVLAKTLDGVKRRLSADDGDKTARIILSEAHAILPGASGSVGDAAASSTARNFDLDAFFNAEDRKARGQLTLTDMFSLTPHHKSKSSSRKRKVGVVKALETNHETSAIFTGKDGKRKKKLRKDTCKEKLDFSQYSYGEKLSQSQGVTRSCNVTCSTSDAARPSALVSTICLPAERNTSPGDLNCRALVENLPCHDANSCNAIVQVDSDTDEEGSNSLASSSKEAAVTSQRTQAQCDDNMGRQSNPAAHVHGSPASCRQPRCLVMPSVVSSYKPREGNESSSATDSEDPATQLRCFPSSATLSPCAQAVCDIVVETPVLRQCTGSQETLHIADTPTRISYKQRHAGGNVLSSTPILEACGKANGQHVTGVNALVRTCRSEIDYVGDNSSIGKEFQVKEQPPAWVDEELRAAEALLAGNNSSSDFSDMCDVETRSAILADEAAVASQWTCTCGAENAARVDDCSSCSFPRVPCFALLSEGSSHAASQPISPGVDSSAPSMGTLPTATTDDMRSYKRLFFCVSQHTSRIHVYDEEKQPLGINFLLTDADQPSSLPQVLQLPQNLGLIQRFVLGWNRLKTREQAVLIKKGILMDDAEAMYSWVCSVSGRLTKQRYVTKEELALASSDAATSVNGHLRIIVQQPSLPQSRGSAPSAGTISTIVNKIDIGEALGTSGSNTRLTVPFGRGYVQAIAADGTPMCIWCRKLFQTDLLTKEAASSARNAWQTRFCSRKCHEEHKTLTSRQYGRVLTKRCDAGICERCGVNTLQIFSQLRATSSLEERAHLIQNSCYRSLSKQAKMEMVKHPVEGQFWHADHIKPVYAGGGQCDMDNLRTLCTPCHSSVTAVQAQQRTRSRKLGGMIGTASITRFFTSSPS